MIIKVLCFAVLGRDRASNRFQTLSTTFSTNTQQKMAAKFQIYLRDDLVNRSNYTAKRKVQEIQPILRNIDHSSTLPQKIHPTNQGFMVTYTNDSDVNFIFNPTNISLLKNQNLISEHARETHNLRQTNKQSLFKPIKLQCTIYE